MSGASALTPSCHHTLGTPSDRVTKFWTIGFVQKQYFLGCRLPLPPVMTPSANPVTESRTFGQSALRPYFRLSLVFELCTTMLLMFVRAPMSLLVYQQKILIFGFLIFFGFSACTPSCQCPLGTPSERVTKFLTIGTPIVFKALRLL